MELYQNDPLIHGSQQIQAVLLLLSTAITLK